jgi:membrane peptidoglycan carboxypeptidase
MSNNYWNQQPENNNGSHNNGSPRSGSLVRNYSDQTVQAPPQYSPLMGQAPQGVPPSQYSPIPPVNTPQQQGWPSPQAWPTPSFIGNAMQTVRRWTGKMAAARGGNVDQDPLVLYRPATPPPEQAPRPNPWKRSHSVRVAMQMRHRRERWNQGRPTGQRIAMFSVTIFVVLLVIILTSGAASGYAYYQSQLPRLQGLANQQINQSTRIYDRNGKLLYVAYDNKTGTGTGRSTPVTYNDIPGVMQDAMTAAEDHTFWDNTGIDPQGILRAATQYSSSGTVQSGGSTITQQVIKNLNENLTHEVAQATLQRKIPEAALAIGLTQQYPKWKILEMYFNISPFGAQELGVDAAAEDYFGLHAKCDVHFNCIPAIAFLDRDLTKCKNPNDDSTCRENPLLGLARASLLAGMPQNPVSYDPTLGKANKILALQRQDYVLQQMLALNMHINTALGDQTIDNGPITPDIIQQIETMTSKMTFKGFQPIKNDPHFVDWIISQMEYALGTDPNTGNVIESTGANLFLTGGFNIRTTIDSNLQTYVENAAKRHLDQPEYQPFTGGYGPLNITNNVNDSAVVVMNAKTGEVLAMNGSTDWNNTNKEVDGQFNAATAARSPGSSFKPIVLATAMEMGWYEGIVLPDKKTYFPEGLSQSLPVQTSTYIPTDYGGDATNKVYHNTNYNIRWNIANSLNVPAVKTAYFAGAANVYTMAQRLGITAFTSDQSKVPSMGIGSGSATLLQMTDAYQAFADNGMRIPPHGILDIYDNYGHRLYHYDPSKPDGGQAISSQIAFMITSILKDESARYPEFQNDHVLSMWDQTTQPNGQALPGGIPHPEVATKTGTTDNFTDNWTLGYTPDVVVGVWTGNADNSPMVNSIGITGAAPIWHSIIEYVSGYCNTATDQIPCPPLDLHFSDRAFPPPPQGVVQSSVNTVNGLAGSGYLSWMLDGEQPQQSGLTARSGNGNGNGTPTPTPTP